MLIGLSALVDRNCFCISSPFGPPNVILQNLERKYPDSSAKTVAIQAAILQNLEMNYPDSSIFNQPSPIVKSQMLNNHLVTEVLTWQATADRYQERVETPTTLCGQVSFFNFQHAMV